MIPTDPRDHPVIGKRDKWCTGDPARIEALLKTSGSYMHPDLDARDNRGYTPFMVACAGGHVDTVVVLCAAGCDCTLRNQVGLVRHVDIAPRALVCPRVHSRALVCVPRTCGVS